MGGKRMDNKTKLEVINAKPLYYYLKSNERRAVTVCLIVRDRVALSRGIAICSPLDEFNKRKGRAIACGRAIQTLHYRKSILPINHKRRFFYGFNEPLYHLKFTCKGNYFPAIDGFEEELMAKQQKRCNDMDNKDKSIEYEDGILVECGEEECGWKGTASECKHGYVGVAGGEDVELTDLCPKCGSIALKWPDADVSTLTGCNK